MATEQQIETSAYVVRRRCALDGAVLIYKEELTEFPEFSGWECPECGLFEIES